ncbi:MAG: hypothetical protein N7Q72_02725, partial [Spiroplasma sp. Tabriz.8]|nr:hypothetical protein [Spiroplasma sp. Tabriz.8]
MNYGLPSLTEFKTTSYNNNNNNNNNYYYYIYILYVFNIYKFLILYVWISSSASLINMYYSKEKSI